MGVEAISYDRYLSDNMFEALVLLSKPPKRERKMSYKGTEPADFLRTSQSVSPPSHRPLPSCTSSTNWERS